jgi:membrane-bound metal-dependent hydrolase YbcI (DUF457 family)
LPVLGHAFVGVATAACVRPRTHGLRAALWTPLLVGLAYLPDLVSQIGDLVAADRWRLATHSMLFAFLAAVFLAWPVAAWSRRSRIFAFALALFSVLTHQLMDLLQGTDDRPFWPFSGWRADYQGWAAISSLKSEVVCFGGFCLVLLLARWFIVRWHREFWQRGQPDLSPQSPGGRGLRSLGWVLTAVFLVLAAGTHYLRDLRVQQVAAAELYIHQHRPAEALACLDRAARWPRVISQAGLDYIRGEAYDEMGDRPRAEQYYLAALRGDRDSLWMLADLAVLYATSSEPLELRRQKVEPLVARMRAHHAQDTALPRILAKIDRKLAAPATRPATQP